VYQKALHRDETVCASCNDNFCPKITVTENAVMQNITRANRTKQDGLEAHTKDKKCGTPLTAENLKEKYNRGPCPCAGKPSLSL
jgi:hypothetical protein